MEFKILKIFDDLEPYIEAVCIAADKNTKSLGFLPRPAYSDHALQGRLWVCVQTTGGAYAGHLIFGGKLPTLNVLQLYVEDCFRNAGIAKQLLRELEIYGEEHGCLSIAARVAADLEANRFWEHQGFMLYRQVDGGQTTGRRINVRVKNLDVPSLFYPSEFPSETQHRDLKVNANTTLTSSTYAIDLNVLLDLTKDRKNAGDVRRLLSYSLYGSRQICVTSELVGELEKQTHKFPHGDPLLELTKGLPILPSVSANVLEPTIGLLSPIIFPERHHQHKLRVNDIADLKHIALCIHHKIAGFITSDAALLRSSEMLFQSFGIEVLSPSDVVASYKSFSEEEADPLSVLHDGAPLTIAKFEEATRADVEKFLERFGVSECDHRQMLASGVVGRERTRWVAKAGELIVGYASWGGDEERKLRNIFLVVDEQRSVAQQLIDHFLEKAASSLPESKLVLLVLHTMLGSDLTRRTAIDRGFRRVGIINDAVSVNDLVKPSFKGLVTKSSWNTFRASLSSLTDVLLPERMPTMAEFLFTGAVAKSKANPGIVKLPLFECETLFSPAVFVCDGRDGAIVPIKRHYFERLMPDSTPQTSWLPGNEALLHVEKAYFRASRNAKRVQRGDLLFFYVSGKIGGQEIVGHGRVTSSGVMSADSAAITLKRQGALEDQDLTDIADDQGNVHAITFDNFLYFKKPVPFQYLKRKNLISRANLITVERISSGAVVDLIAEGYPGG